MRLWESKTKGFVSEKTSDVWTGVLSSNGKKIYEGDTLRIEEEFRRFEGKTNRYNGITPREYNNPNNWSIYTKTYEGVVFYKDGRFFIEGLECVINGLEKFKTIELFPNMTRFAHSQYKVEIIDEKM